MKSVTMTFVLPVFLLSFCFAQDLPNCKIIPPPQGGMYLGQYEILPGDIDTFQAAVGKKVAWGHNWGVDRDGQGHPVFDPLDAETEWALGRVVIAEAYEAIPDSDSMIEGVLPMGFTVDKLLQGVYETQLTALAAQFRAFGKPMFFNTAREPLGVGLGHMGGFGTDGAKSLEWALANKKGLAEFDPSGFPNASLYAGLNDPQVSDGVERLVAAQRYYHDFFVRRQGLNFLTFETMGYTPINVSNELEELPAGVDTAYARKVFETSTDFAHFYPGNAYADWISANLYTMDFYAADWAGQTEDFLVPTQWYLDDFAARMAAFRQVAPGKPVVFLELGFPDGMNRDSQRAADRIRDVFADFIPKYPEIAGLTLWSDHPLFHDPNSGMYFPFDCLIRPGTRQAAALTQVISANPGKFHSCAYITGGTQIATCTEPSRISVFHPQENLSPARGALPDWLVTDAGFSLANPYASSFSIVRMYDINGRWVKTFNPIEQKESLQWDGKARQNRPLAAGRYWIQSPGWKPSKALLLK